MSDHETELRRLADWAWLLPTSRAACLAGADALRRTCGAWQPIETAPKDADMLLLWGPSCGVVSGFWYDDIDDSGTTCWMSSETQGISTGRCEPVYWQHMPDAPKEVSRG